MKIIYFILGMICFVLGAIGVILPILPTTPFLLCAAFFLAKSSRKVNDWFVSTQLYQNHLDSFVQEKTMTLKTKVSILAFASIMLAFPFYFSENLYLRLFIICLYIYKYYYFMFKIKTVSSIKA
ncbi:MAG: YbaN family protein [Coprobacillus sp.]